MFHSFTACRRFYSECGKKKKKATRLVLGANPPCVARRIVGEILSCWGWVILLWGLLPWGVVAGKNAKTPFDLKSDVKRSTPPCLAPMGSGGSTDAKRGRM